MTLSPRFLHLRCEKCQAETKIEDPDYPQIRQIPRSERDVYHAFRVAPLLVW